MAGPAPSPTSASQLRHYIRSLPKADKYTVINEPDLSGMKPCVYYKRWMASRRYLGTKLLWGDFSSHAPLTYTQRAAQCGRLPKSVGFALHPYCTRDPLGYSKPGGDLEGCIDQLGFMKRWLKRNVGLRVQWWLTEFGYRNDDVPDSEAAWLWPRAERQAEKHGAVVLIAYTSQGSTWDTRPGPVAWCSLTRGRACPSARVPVEYREPAKDDGDAPKPDAVDDGNGVATIRKGDTMESIYDY